MDNTRARPPETNVVLGTSRGEEIVDLLVNADGARKILGTTHLSLNQVVTVYGGRVGNGRHASRHELENGHLGGGILAGDAVGPQPEVGDAPLDVLAVRVVEMGVEDLLGVGEGTV